MTWKRPTHRLVDGVRIDGAWCHVWVKGYAEYYLDDLLVFADGAVACGELTDLDGLRRRLESGAITLRDPARPPAEPPSQTPRWLARYPEPMTDDSFLGEVRDQIEALNGRPTTAELCWDAIRAYQRDPSEATRLLVRHAYFAIPAHRRVFVLGEMDRQDIPLRQLVTPVGEPVCGDGPIATPQMHEQVLEYFDAGDRGVEREQQIRAVLHADDAAVSTPAITLHERFAGPAGPPPEIDIHALRNDFVAPFSYRDETYDTVVHGYWAVAAADHADHDRIRDAATARDAHKIGGAVALRPGWASARTAVMAELLRAKFTQHPAIAEVLLSTGDATISYTGISDSPFWTDRGPREGRNWMGRLLELIRADLALAQLTTQRSETKPEPQISALSGYQRGLRTRFLEAALLPAPEPWRPALRHCTPVGGLQGVGFAVDPASGRDLLMVVSIDGHGLFDTMTGEKVARDRDPDPDRPCPDGDLSCPGLGPIAGQPVRIAGLHGGGLHTATSDGWAVDVIAPDWPHERVLLSHAGSPYAGQSGDTWWHLFHADYSELRAAGFSPSGNTLVVATSSDVNIWTRRP